MFFITVWVILKILLDDNYCWNKIEEIPLNYLIDVPIIITVLVSMFYNLVTHLTKYFFVG